MYRPAMLFCLLAAGGVHASGSVVLPQLQLPDGVHSATPGEADFGAIVGLPLMIRTAAAPEPDLNGPVVIWPEAGAAAAEVQAVYDTLLGAGRYDEAARLAERMVQEARDRHGPESRELAWALSDLGAAFQHAGKNELALEPLRQSIALHRRVQGVMHPDLTGVYAYLGMTYQGLGVHDQALDAFSRAQALTHQQFGAHNLQQVKLLDAKAVSLEEQGDLWEAEQLYRTKLTIARSHHGKDSLEALTPLYELADWLTRTGQFKPALSLYREALLLHRDDNGDDTPAMVPAMRGMARTFLLEFQWEVDRGLTLNRRIVAVMDRHPEAFERDQRIRALLDLGDWLVLFEREEEAWATYARAWALTEGDPDWEKLFSRPHMIFAGPPVSLDFMGYGVVGKEQWNDFEFTIERDGRPSHVRILDSNMHKLTRRLSMELLRKARFRPALIDGEPQVTEGYALRRVYPTDPPPDYGAVSVGGQVVSAPPRVNRE